MRKSKGKASGEKAVKTGGVLEVEDKDLSRNNLCNCMQVFSFVSRAYDSQNAQVISRQFLRNCAGKEFRRMRREGRVLYGQLCVWR